MPRKTFNVGDVLTAADVMTYFMNQVTVTCTSVTRPGSPITNQFIYETDTGYTLMYSGSAWVLPWAQSTYAYKPVDQNVTNNTSLQDATFLSLPLIAGGRYEFKATIVYEATDVQDAKFSVTYPSDAFVTYGAQALALTTAAGSSAAGNLYAGAGKNVASTWGGWPVGGIGGGLSALATMEGSIVAVTAGALQVRFAENVAAAATFVDIKQGSLLRLTRFA